MPAPEALPTEAELKERIWPMMPEPVRRYYERERPIELRPVEMGRYLGEKNPEGRSTSGFAQRENYRTRPRSINACWPTRQT